MTRLAMHLTNRDENSGGMRAVYYLHDTLLKAGYDVFLEGPLKDSDVVIVTDNQPQNRYGACRVCRFMCYFAHARGIGYHNGRRIPADQCVIVYHEDYLADIAAHYDGVLTDANVVTVPSIEPGLFVPEEKTIEKVVYIGKGQFENSEEWDGAPIVPKGSMFAGLKRAEYAALIRRAKNLYSCDHHTVAVHEAALAGCQAWYVRGKYDYVRYDSPHPERYLMRPEEDVAIAHRFVGLIREFFKDDTIGAP